jgi:hypothetical protein
MIESTITTVMTNIIGNKAIILLGYHTVRKLFTFNCSNATVIAILFQSLNQIFSLTINLELKIFKHFLNFSYRFLTQEFFFQCGISNIYSSNTIHIKKIFYFKKCVKLLFF